MIEAKVYSEGEKKDIQDWEAADLRPRAWGGEVVLSNYSYEERIAMWEAQSDPKDLAEHWCQGCDHVKKGYLMQWTETGLWRCRGCGT